jgi:tRNA/tmRNA/rRNA uracil-C5-methylase (TrmA/RlmC/RlmD family)
VSSFCITINNGLADVVKASDYALQILRGEGQYFEQLHLTHQGETTISQWRVSPFSFFQTNTYGAELLFSTALAMIGTIKGNIIDLYCGSGTIGLSFLKAGLGKAVKGIEIVADAVQDAYFNAKIN